MTTKDWELVRRRCTLWRHAKMKADGYELSLTEARLKNKVYILIYVDGKVDYSLTDTDNEVRRKFFWKRSRSFYSREYIKGMEKLQGKRACKAEGIYRKIEMWFPYWASFSRLKSHFKKNCDALELVD